MIAQVDRRKDEAADEGKKDVEEDLFVTACEKEDHENNLRVTAGHAIPFVALKPIQNVPDKIGEKGGPLKGNSIEMGQRISRADGGKENIPDKREIITEGQDEYGRVEFRSPVLQVQGRNEDDGEKIVADVAEGHDIREPGDDPLLHPEGRIDPEEELIDLDQDGIDIRTDILDQVPEGLIDQDDKKDGRKIVDKGRDPAAGLSLRR